MLSGFEQDQRLFESLLRLLDLFNKSRAIQYRVLSRYMCTYQDFGKHLCISKDLL